MTRMVLIRHGETEDNRAGVLQGQAGKPLSEVGHAQARRLAQRLAPFRFDACWTSDQPRARETAEHLVAVHDLVPLITRGLREVYVGTWQGKTPGEISEEYPEQYAAWMRGEDIARGGGETYEEVSVRCGAALGSIAEAYPDGVVLIVSHGAALRSTMQRLLGLPLGALGGLHNTSISVFDYVVDGQKFSGDRHAWHDTHTLHVWNDTGHVLPDDEDALGSLLPRKDGTRATRGT